MNTPVLFDLSAKQLTAIIFAIVFYALDIMDWQLLVMVGSAFLKDTGLTKEEFGLLLGGPLIGVGISGFFAGVLADRFGRSKVMILCLVWYSVLTLAFPYAQDFAQMLIIRILAGIGMGAQWGVGNAMVAEWLPPHWRAKASAGIQSGFCVGAIAAAYWARELAPELGWKSIFLIGYLGLLVAALATLFLRDAPRYPTSNLAASKKVNFMDLLTLVREPNRRVTTASFLMLLGATLAYWASMSWIPTWLVSERNILFIKSMDFMVLVNLGGLASFIVIGIVGDRYGRKLPAMLGFASASFSLLVFVSIQTEEGLRWFAPAYGFFSSPVFGLFGVYLSELYPMRMRATAVTALYNTARLISFAGPTLLAWLASQFSMTVAIGCTSVLYLACVLPLLTLPETLVDERHE